MAREIKTIMEQIIAEKNKRLELNDMKSDSKVSVFNGWAWITATVIHSFEVVLDLFRQDIDQSITNRINGTPSFYINALLNYQDGDSLTITNNGMNFGYEQIDSQKRTITRASYQEGMLSDISLDKLLLLKVATGTIGDLQPISPEQLVRVSAYVDEIKFAGVNTQVVSRKGDILLPRLTIFHDGSLPERTLRNNVNDAINNFIKNMSFDSALYITKLFDAIISVDHVTDVYADPDAIPAQGVSVIDFNEAGEMGDEKIIKRYDFLISGFLRESSKKGGEKDVPNFDDCIIVKNETR